MNVYCITLKSSIDFRRDCYTVSDKYFRCPEHAFMQVPRVRECEKESRTEGSLLEDAKRKGRWLSDFLSVRTLYVLSWSSERERKVNPRRRGSERVRAIKARPNKYKR